MENQNDLNEGVVQLLKGHTDTLFEVKETLKDLYARIEDLRLDGTADKLLIKVLVNIIGSINSVPLPQLLQAQLETLLDGTDPASIKLKEKCLELVSDRTTPRT